MGYTSIKVDGTEPYCVGCFLPTDTGLAVRAMITDDHMAFLIQVCDGRTGEEAAAIWWVVLEAEGMAGVPLPLEHSVPYRLCAQCAGRTMSRFRVREAGEGADLEVYSLARESDEQPGAWLC